jgi:hypothetical protein
MFSVLTYPFEQPEFRSGHRLRNLRRRWNSARYWRIRVLQTVNSKSYRKFDFTLHNPYRVVITMHPSAQGVESCIHPAVRTHIKHYKPHTIQLTTTGRWIVSTGLYAPRSIGADRCLDGRCPLSSRTDRLALATSTRQKLSVKNEAP